MANTVLALTHKKGSDMFSIDGIMRLVLLANGKLLYRYLSYFFSIILLLQQQILFKLTLQLGTTVVSYPNVAGNVARGLHS